ncbi:Putative ketoacyl reductase [Grimontia celer]|uniref:Putative ketoacyl reductase n=1 Tax=Grimontia celer TaxID=1796497 RepID=A0A128EYC8_9GAMM|nr:SDR family NAD(P)-dependent oxidoreductase [Grimontia celer]CZF79235.1 Putative ketoacyl reductase [Grimontia celer]
MDGEEAISKTALVTGGNRGIGLAIVRGLAEQGMTVLLGCRNVEEGEKVALSLLGDIHIVELDLSSALARQTSIKAIDEQFPNIDVLVNNAGVLLEDSFKTLSYETLMKSMEVNALAAFELTQFFANKMEAQGYGRVVNISSDWGAFSDGLTGPAAYSMSKAALNGITLVASQSYTKVKINAMCPGWVRTDMGGDSATRSPDEGAETAIWLATLDDAAPTGKFFRDKAVISW